MHRRSFSQILSQLSTLLCLIPAAALGLNELLTILAPAAPKWYPLGVQFKLSTFDLHEIEKEFQGQSKPAEQLEQMTKLVVERSEPKPTWRMVVDGLRGIQENSLAQEVETKFCELGPAVMCTYYVYVSVLHIRIYYVCITICHCDLSAQDTVCC